MIECTGNLWTYQADFRVITTNGSIRKDGTAVMGRGCAREAATKYPRLAKMLGTRLRMRGNVVHFFSDQDIGDRCGLFTFPVKHEWPEPADLELIAQSVEKFTRLLLGSATYVMPRPGCGNGQLTWEQVKPLLVDLPDNVHVIDFERRLY